MKIAPIIRAMERAGMPQFLVHTGQHYDEAVSDLLFVSERSGLENLKREGIPDERVHFVGNVMIDTLLFQRSRAKDSDVLSRLGLDAGQPYALVTLHRPSNVDDPDKLRALVSALEELARDIPVVFPIHPRTRRNVEEAGLRSAPDKIRLV